MLRQLLSGAENSGAIKKIVNVCGACLQTRVEDKLKMRRRHAAVDHQEDSCHTTKQQQKITTFLSSRMKTRAQVFMTFAENKLCVCEVASLCDGGDDKFSITEFRVGQFRERKKCSLKMLQVFNKLFIKIVSVYKYI